MPGRTNRGPRGRAGYGKLSSRVSIKYTKEDAGDCMCSTRDTFDWFMEVGCCSQTYTRGYDNDARTHYAEVDNLEGAECVMDLGG